ncbi:uncharacterized protein LOC130725096 [Lotus japonicus]|uniref:uncharacterized protein LOC130725096 n=1 Tax=Lotus japonicus TaxID=34305 RepID=UPI00258B8E90|nr:uncharacterized protein LOC130725096 [Lotus japonicus]
MAEFEPFSAAVREVAIPDNMKNIVLETYSGKADPKEHLLYFNTKMVISAALDAVKCRMFPATFKGTTKAWFTTLLRGSITNFRDFSSKFLVQFSASKTRQVTIEDLYNVRQSAGETLKQYVKRFSVASVKIEESEPNSCAPAFKNGLQPGKLNSKLSRKPAKSMAKVRARANTYILDEEDDAFKRRRAKVERDGDQGEASPEIKASKDNVEGSKRRDKKVRAAEKTTRDPLYPRRDNAEHRRPWHQADSRRRGESGKSLSAHLTELLREVKATHAVEEGEREADPPRPKSDKTKWCEYHRSVGHDTGDCFTLKNEIEKLIRAGRAQLNDYNERWNGERQQGNRYRNSRQQDDRRREDRRRTASSEKKETLATKKKNAKETFNKDIDPPVGTINTIAGGFGGGGDTASARRRHVRAVTSVQQYRAPFGFQHPDIVISSADFEGVKMHKDDPVVVMVRINSFNVRRVLLDQGSSADIIYGDAFDKLGLTNKDLMPYTGTLVGFSGEQVWVRGYIDLDTVFGVEDNAKLLRVRYLVIQVVASYNVIIGRNTLNCLCAVISTAHLAVKYPLLCGKVGKIVVDQRRARE